jgi:hypothetical protein
MGKSVSMQAFTATMPGNKTNQNHTSVRLVKVAGYARDLWKHPVHIFLTGQFRIFLPAAITLKNQTHPMKKLILACLLGASLGLLAGCSKKTDDSQQAPPAPQTPPASATHQ